MAYSIYRILMHLLTVVAEYAGMFNEKLQKRNTGLRKQQVPELSGCIWVHCASLGEFEQGKVLIDELRIRYPDKNLVLTFFSASGYERQNKYFNVDHVLYLPYDSPGRMRRFVNQLNPDLVIFVKYEFWYNLLDLLAKKGIRFVFVSSVFRPEQYLFHPLFASLLSRILESDHIFVQNSESRDLLLSRDFDRVSIAGDTRIDRVLELRDKTFDWPALETWLVGHTCMIAGSSWPKDEILIQGCIPQFRNWKWIIVPHEVTRDHISGLERMFEGRSVLLSTIGMVQPVPDEFDVLVIDRIGLLSLIYRYGDIAYVGGGHGAGIHNTLEPAVYGLPLVFGPKYQNFQEAVDFMERGTAREVRTTEQLIESLRYLADPGLRLDIKATQDEYFVEHSGATRKIMVTLEKIMNRA